MYVEEDKGGKKNLCRTSQSSPPPPPHHPVTVLAFLGRAIVGVVAQKLEQRRDDGEG